MNNICSSNGILSNNTCRGATNSNVLHNVKVEFIGNQVEFIGKQVELSKPSEKPRVSVEKALIEEDKVEERDLNSISEYLPVKAEFGRDGCNIVPFPTYQLGDAPKPIKEPKPVKRPNVVKLTKLTNMPKFLKKPNPVKMPTLASIPRLVSNYIASFLNTKKELFWLALILNRCGRNSTKFQPGSFHVDCFGTKEMTEQFKDIYNQRAKLHCFWEIVILLRSRYVPGLILNWLRENSEFCDKISKIDDSYDRDGEVSDLIDFFSFCKNLNYLKTDCIQWFLNNISMPSNTLEHLELTSTVFDLDPAIIKKVFPNLKFLEASFHISFYEEQINESTKILNELSQIYSGIRIHLSFTSDQFDSVISWCSKNHDLSKYVAILAGASCPLLKSNKDKWKELIEKLPNLTYLVIGSTHTPFVLTAQNSKIRKILVRCGISKNLTLKNLPQLETLNYGAIKKNATLTLSGVPKLNNINGEIQRPLTAIEIEYDEKKIRQCKVLDEDFLTK